MKHNLLYTMRFFYRIFLLVFFGLLVLGQFQKIYVTPIISFYLHEIFIAIGGIGSWIFYPKDVFAAYKRLPFFTVLILFSVVAGISVYSAGFRGLPIFIGLLYLFRVAMYTSLFPLITIGIQKRYVTRTDVIYIAVIFVYLLAMFGIVQYVIFPDLRWLTLLGWDDHYFRLVSTLLDPPFPAALFTLVLLGVYPKLHRLPIIMRLGWCVTFVALLFTYSRAGYASYIIGLIVYGFMKRERKILIVLALFTVGIFFLPRPASEGARLERTVSVQARNTAITSTLQTFTLRTWIIGDGWYLSQSNRGFTQNYIPSHSSAPGNSFVTVLQSTGIIGLSLFGVFLLQLLWFARSNTIGISMIVSILIGSLFNNLIFYPWVMVAFWTAIGIVYARRYGIHT
ncbi:MAG: hypothetical protein HZA34_00940 [Candidatus Pacebacteria bacterium]|nr:hypothetical protein [Candidatus Paceibacterota bacterium]